MLTNIFSFDFTPDQKGRTDIINPYFTDKKEGNLENLNDLFKIYNVKWLR